jgi:hypothetical protein
MGGGSGIRLPAGDEPLPYECRMDIQIAGPVP